MSMLQGLAGFSLAALALTLSLSLILLQRSAPGGPKLGTGAKAVVLSFLFAFAAFAYVRLGQTEIWLHPAASSFDRAGVSPGSVSDVAQDAGEVARNGAEAIGPEQVKAMVLRLAEKLKAQPDNAQGWRMLARSYENLQRFDAAVQAYRELHRLTPNDADMLADYAVTLAMSQGRQSLVGEPEALIRQALTANPDHLQALALAGSVALDQGRFREAVAYWKRVLAVVPSDTELARQVEQSISRIQVKIQ